MNNKFISTVIFCSFASLVTADTANSWKCAGLLDGQTKSSLLSQERYFNNLFQLPGEYRTASESEKKRIVNLWIKDLQGSNYEVITRAAAYLGVVKAKQAVGDLEKLLAASKNQGRTRWVCTRSLGQIGEQSSIPVLISHLDNLNRETRVYARVALAEITGVYFGEDKRKWESWQANPAGTQTENSPGSVNNSEAVKKLKQLIDEKYSYRDLCRVDWDRLFRIAAGLEKTESPQEFAELAAKVLLNARDMHLWVKIDDKTVGGFRRAVKRNYNIEFLKRTVPGWKDLSQDVSIGRFPDNIGYVLITSWQKDEEKVLKPALKAINELSDTKALIIDVRPNGGGSEPFAAKIAGCFIDKPVVYAKHVYRDKNSPTGWGKTFERTLKPNPDLPLYRGKIAVLMGQGNMSSCEAFLLMMKQVSNCKLIGQKSYGSSGNPRPYDLGNGVTVWLPSWKALRPDGTCFEGQGIKPGMNVLTKETQLRRKDPVLESALRYLRSMSR